MLLALVTPPSILSVQRDGISTQPIEPGFRLPLLRCHSLALGQGV